ncbi:SHC-transforming protein 1-like isoform X2 [Pomacea canaliculata]|uniref:SHC-transforming protein 1-like isoform X2 n=1 Tax=Pomacea canaliculata TaxID=400727 RepID=UPI000D73A92C|nr:SHC-transforming protein 1-like isoform X2 [Pomacea canaliculata]
MSGILLKHLLEKCSFRCHGYSSLHVKKESDMRAAIMDRMKKKKMGQTAEWSRNGSFLNKPEVGWLHPDNQLTPDAGICYGVRYIGCIEVKESMKTLDFETRTTVAREAINRVAEAGGLKTASKRRKVDRKVSRMLGDNPHMHYAGANVNLTISTESISLMVMETGEIIADHPMHVVSFASGGDASTLDFVSYVAKDPGLGRACHVLECGGGLAEDVVTTIGQAFELRFKQYLKLQPQTVQLSDRHENNAFESENWGEDEEYYNDRPGACPPSPGAEDGAPPIPPIPEYRSPCNLPAGTYALVKENGADSESIDKIVDLIDFSEESQTYDNRSARGSGSEDKSPDAVNLYDNRKNLRGSDSKSPSANGFGSDPYGVDALKTSLGDLQFPDGDGKAGVTEKSMKSAHDVAASGAVIAGDACADAGEIDLRVNPVVNGQGPAAPVFEEWYHGKLSRKQTEKLLELDGDFLVRESSNSSNQFVLSGKQNGSIKHLLLVDPEGIVRTKDYIFDSISHLVNYHRQNGLPIITQGSELHLVRPIKTCISAC